MLIWVLFDLGPSLTSLDFEHWQSRVCSAPRLRRHGEALKQQGWRGVWLQLLHGQGAPGSQGASAVPPHQAFACLAAHPFAAEQLGVEALAAGPRAAGPRAAGPHAAGPLAAGDPLAVQPLAAGPLAVDLLALCDAAAAAVAAGWRGIELTEQFELALTLTVTASLAWLACPRFLNDLAFQACPGALQSFAAALQSPAAALCHPFAHEFAALPVAGAPCLPTSFFGTSAAGLCQTGQTLFCQQY